MAGMTKSPLVGTELKIKVGLSIGGTDWKNLPSDTPSHFKLEFYSTSGDGGIVTIEGEAPTGLDFDDGTFLAIVDTAITGAGTIMMKVTADIYDDDMSEEPSSDEAPGYRREVALYNTGIKVYE